MSDEHKSGTHHHSESAGGTAWCEPRGQGGAPIEQGSSPIEQGGGVEAFNMNRWLNKTFADALQWAAQEHGEREALVFNEERLTYRQLLARVDAFARGLIRIGIRPGDHVCIWMPDCVEFMVARWAVPSLGAVLVPINTRFRDSEISYLLRQSDAKAVILKDRFREISYFDILQNIIPDYREQDRSAWSVSELPALRHVIALGDALPQSMHSFEETEVIGAGMEGQDMRLDEFRAAIKSGDVAQILYTSGTTSFPKGAMVCHGALLQNNYYTTHALKMGPEDRYLSAVPLFSATGTSYTLSVLLCGGAIVVADRFTPEHFCRLVEQERITMSFFVDAMVQDLKSYSDLMQHDLSTLRTGAGAPLSLDSAKWLVEILGIQEFTSVFGMSETSNSMSRAGCEEPLEKRLHTNGRPNPGVHIKIVDLDTGRPLPPGKVGEICVKGFSVMNGYYNNPRENEQCFDEEGWFHGGDLGEMTGDGYLVYRGRVKEMIKPGGFNVATGEIEEFLKTLPAIKEAAVVGVPDGRLGEVGFAYLELEPGQTATEEELLQACKGHIAAYKVPRYVDFVTDWPMTSTGKLKKLELKERAMEKLNAHADIA